MKLPTWIRDEVPLGTIIRWHMGRAYYDPIRQHSVTFVMPFNWVVGLLRSAWLWIRLGPDQSRWDDIVQRQRWGVTKEAHDRMMVRLQGHEYRRRLLHTCQKCSCTLHENNAVPHCEDTCSIAEDGDEAARFRESMEIAEHMIMTGERP